MHKIPLLLLVFYSSLWANEEATVDLINGATMEFVWIEAGSFTMGSPASEPGRRENEGPQHEVTISQGFYMGKYEVTQRQWERVMGTTPWALGLALYVESDPSHPAVYISWADAREFAQQLNAAAGDSLYRLPTEAEWEFAARAGTSMPWSFGEDESQLGEYAWYRDNAWGVDLKYAQPVGTKLANPWGLYDMHGNAAEWTQDWEMAYTAEAQVDPVNIKPIEIEDRADYHMVRDGAFSAFSASTRSARRRPLGYGHIEHGIGFRLVMMAPNPTTVTPMGWGQIKKDTR
ncbi:MAG: SUMF1/EgtB/PvdO family nonheme iron enzyme [Candidatus Latescibacteria bacterium]|nr:SUMF1/EgtB/PvdO family nonheme iron enzyme [Candidatus Latescibacterota bacterium]